MHHKMALKKGDFIELEYTGRIKDGEVFDTTDEKIAKEAGIYKKEFSYGPVIICLGEGHILKGIDQALIGKEIGEYKIELPPEKAFGKRDAKLLKLVPLSAFKEHKIEPVPGMQVIVDGVLATIKTVSGGRCLVDFNHPLAGRFVEYDVKILRKIEDTKEKIEALLKLYKIDAEVHKKDEKYEIKLKTKPKELPSKAKDEIKSEIKRLVGVEAVFLE